MDDIRAQSGSLQDALARIDAEFAVDTAQLKRITERFTEELSEGLERPEQNLAMEPAWVLGTPSGNETGSYLVVDFGGTKLRVCWVTLRTNREKTDLKQKIYYLPQEIKTATAAELWDLVATSIHDFIADQGLVGEAGPNPIPLGFTFSYPLSQERVSHGKLKRWTKGWAVSGVEGEDVALQISQALETRKVPVTVVAVVNDTVGALMASSYYDTETIIGAIFGTGCNAAYMEPVGSIPKLKTEMPPDTPMAINCEYGAFDNAHRVLPRTQYDETIDRESNRVGEQTFEKMTAGLYLGEIYRLVMVDLEKRGLVFQGQDVSKLQQAYKLDTGFLSALENDTLDDVRARFRSVLDLGPSDEELLLSRHLAETVTTRAARLCACGIAAICRKRGIESGHVAADGSVANKHPQFRARWSQALAEILDWRGDRLQDPITMTSAEDGSGIGAAVVAAVTLGSQS